MAIEVAIKLTDQNQSLQIQEALLPGMRYGIMDAAYRLDENQTGQYMVIFADGPLCRGYEISLPPGALELRLPIPTSEREIRFFYDYVRQMCQRLHTNEFTREGLPGSLAEIEAYIQEDVGLSKSTLKMMEKDTGEKYKHMYIFGVMNPIAVNQKDLQAIDCNLQKLEDFLHRLQSWDVYYAKPNVYRKNDETLFGIYTLPEKVPTVLPREPGLFMGPKDLQIDEWYVGFVIDDKLAGTIAYADFVANTKPEAEYDAEHFVAQLNRRQMQKLLTAHQKRP